MYPSKQFCFTCLGKNSTSDDLVDMTTVDLDGISYIRKLKKCVRGQLVGGPAIICLECVERLRIAYNFRETVLLSQKLLRETSGEADKDVCDEESGGIKDEPENNENCVEVTNVIIKEESEVLRDIDSNESNSAFNSDVLAKLCNELEIDGRKTTKKKTKHKAAHEVRYEPFDCNLCASKFQTRRQLRQHLSQDHKQRHVCPHCDREFKQAFHLREHVTSHTGERMYCCNLCGKTFQRLSSQSRHMKSHERAPGQKTKRTPFLCTICGKRFPFSNGLQRHMRMHMNIKLHECEVCLKRFNQRAHLRVHMRTHTGEKPYICDTCGNQFSLNASLQKHMVLHHRAEKKKASPVPESVATD